MEEWVAGWEELSASSSSTRNQSSKVKQPFSSRLDGAEADGDGDDGG